MVNNIASSCDSKICYVYFIVTSSDNKVVKCNGYYHIV